MLLQMVELAAVRRICKSQTKCNLILGMTQGRNGKKEQITMLEPSAKFFGSVDKGRDEQSTFY